MNLFLFTTQFFSFCLIFLFLFYTHNHSMRRCTIKLFFFCWTFRRITTIRNILSAFEITYKFLLLIYQWFFIVFVLQFVSNGTKIQVFSAFIRFFYCLFVHHRHRLFSFFFGALIIFCTHWRFHTFTFDTVVVCQ